MSLGTVHKANNAFVNVPNQPDAGQYVWKCALQCKLTDSINILAWLSNISTDVDREQISSNLHAMPILKTPTRCAIKPL